MLQFLESCVQTFVIDETQKKKKKKNIHTHNKNEQIDRGKCSICLLLATALVAEKISQDNISVLTGQPIKTHSLSY